ncbi:unnamed protein product [Anisakis simplex]|uniref:Uncharacterized protein n=1 Tax=Anisakis simplex TaxID=6269 RepID=A0A3P6R8L9_ANISI|nr:unnamed protein product [Anisakis simplex]
MISCFCLAVPIILPQHAYCVFPAFLLFEVCVGIFWPAMGYMRGIYIPEQTRSTIMNFCRIPLNMIVITILLQNLKMHIIFQSCVIFLILATLAQHFLYRRILSLNTSKAEFDGTITSVNANTPNNTPSSSPVTQQTNNNRQNSTKPPQQFYSKPIAEQTLKRQDSLPIIKDPQHQSITMSSDRSKSLNDQNVVNKNNNLSKPSPCNNDSS